MESFFFRGRSSQVSLAESRCFTYIEEPQGKKRIPRAIKIDIARALKQRGLHVGSNMAPNESGRQLQLAVAVLVVCCCLQLTGAVGAETPRPSEVVRNDDDGRRNSSGTVTSSTTAVSAQSGADRVQLEQCRETCLEKVRMEYLYFSSKIFGLFPYYDEQNILVNISGATIEKGAYAFCSWYYFANYAKYCMAG